MHKLLTVVIPTYNMEKYLDRCLSSLVVDDEKMETLEVLVVNDGSKDRSSEIAHGYESRYPGTFRVIDKENGNYGSCVNRGLAEATGQYIKILDADDLFDTQGLSCLMDALSSSGGVPDMVITDIRYLDESGEVCHKLTFPSLTENIGIPMAAMDDSVVDALHMHAITYKTEILRQSAYHQTEGVSYTDLEWTYYPMASVRSFQYENEYVYQYNTSREGQTTTAEKHCRDMWMERNLITKMVDSFVHNDSFSGTEQQHYMERKLFDYCKQIYYYHLLAFPRLLSNRDLKEFDGKIIKAGSLYSNLSNETLPINRIGNVRYIDLWRKHRNRCSFPFFFHDFQEAVSKIVHKVF